MYRRRGDKRFRKQVLATKKFEEYAATNLIFIEVDLPPDLSDATPGEAKNIELVNKFGIEPLPTLILLDADGKILMREEGMLEEGPKEFIARLEQARHKGTKVSRGVD